MAPCRLFLLATTIAISFLPGSTAEARKVHWRQTGASVFGSPCENSGIGYRGANLDVQWRSFAELGMGTLLGGLPEGAAVRVLSPRTHRRMTIRKLDIGGGGASVRGLVRGMDLRAPVARYIAGAGCSWTGVVLWRRA